MMEPIRANELPTQSRKFWIVMLLLFAVVMVSTMLKDWWLTAEEPNILFYIFVPTLAILGGVLSMYGMARFCEQTITFLAILAISIGANTVMQVVEIVMKITYYHVWEYPGILYLVLVIPLGFVLMAYGLVRWGNMKWWMAGS
jgi:hypothetical protein